MSDTNLVVLSGRLTNDPVLRFVGQQDTAVCEFGLATNRIYGKEENGSQKRETTFNDVTVWGKQGENCEKWLQKGSSVIVEGRLQQHEWETKDGEKRKKIRVVADRVNFLSNTKGGNGSSGKNGQSEEEPVDESVDDSSDVVEESKSRAKKVVKDSGKKESTKKESTKPESTKPEEEYVPF